MGMDAFFFKNRNSFFDRKDDIGEYVKRTCPEQVAEVMKAADDVCQQKFIFNLRRDMERTYEYVEFKDQIDWLHIPKNDPEWSFQFNRHHYWICLGQAYAISKNEKYAKTFVSQLLDWIDKVKKNDPACSNAWRTIEIGLRLEYWLKSIRYFEGSPSLTEEVYKVFADSVTEHCEMAMEIYDEFRVMSNWGIMQHHGLFLAGVMLPETERTREYRDTALQRLAQEVMIQVYDDGSDWEQSPMYHNEVLHDLLDVIILARRNAIYLPEGFMDKVHKMCYVTMYYTKPNHMELLAGDSDNIDMRDILTKGAYLFSDRVLKFSAYDSFDFDVIWDLGYEAMKSYEQLPQIMPSGLLHALADSGNYFWRSGWKENDTYFHFHCGTLGAGHGHSDMLHINLYANGEDVLTDTGRYTYVAGGERYAFKDSSAHNTITMDGKNFLHWVDSWCTDQFTQPVNRVCKDKNGYAYIEGGYIGYNNQFVNRKIVCLQPDLYLIADELYAQAEHTWQQYFHFNHEGNVSKSDTGYSYKSDKSFVELLQVGNDTAEIADTRMSLNYNSFKKNQTVKTNVSCNGFAAIFTLISVNRSNDIQPCAMKKLVVHSTFKKIVFSDDLIEAVSITKGTETYTVVCAHKDWAAPTDTFEADGCIGFGKVVVFNKKRDTGKSGTVLLW